MRTKLFNLLTVLALALGFALVTQPSDVAAQGTWYREVTFDSANVVTADEQSSTFTGVAEATLAGFEISCTEDSGTASLDVAVQRSIDGGTVWTSIVSFTQLTATGSEVKLYADVRTASAQMIGNRLRINYDITGTGQYTCSTYGAFEA